MEDRYELRGKIGQGGIGRVHRAFDHRMKREVAIKRILTSEDDPSLADEATKQLLVEAGALASLQHPNIVTVHDVGADDLGPYVVMELISGRTLDEVIEDAPLTWDDFKIVATQSLEALIAAQELNMIHSDLKPPNIMLTWLPSGTFQVKIVDFGLAILIQNQSPEEIAAMDSVFGSVFFMPPEQFERQPLDTRSDLYSLGCCLYQSLAGAYPFTGTTGSEVMDAHLNHQVIPLQEVRADIPIWACQWIMWLINRNPEDRPESAREALSNFIQNDKDSNPTLSQGGAQVARSKLIIPGAISATGLVPTATPTSSVHTSNVAITSATQLQGTGAVATATTAHTALGEHPDESEPTIFQRYRKPILFGGVGAGIVILGILIVLLMKRNERVKLENAYANIVNTAASYNVKEVQIIGQQLDIILNRISQSKASDNLKPAYTALLKAKATDGTKVESKIVDFAINGKISNEIKEALFREVIAKRRNRDVIPPVIAYCKKVSDADVGKAAFKAIRPMIREDQAEALLGIIASTKSSEISDEVEAKMEEIIQTSRNRQGLGNLITQTKQSAPKASHEALDRLLELCQPKSQANTNTPKSRPNPAKKPTSNTEGNAAAQTVKTGGQTMPEKRPSPSPAKKDPEFAKLRKALMDGKSDQKLDAIEKLANSPSLDAHSILMHPASSVSDDQIRGKAIEALIKLNSAPEMLENATLAKQRWLQVVWRCKNDEEKRGVVDGLSVIDQTWANEILVEMSQRSDEKLQSYIRSKKGDLF